VYSREHLGVDGASADGFVDEVIAPDSTRARVASCLEALAGAQRPQSRATNIPL
jgi:acetyl-CoA carboxylase carboxyltransferase component